MAKKATKKESTKDSVAVVTPVQVETTPVTGVYNVTMSPWPKHLPNGTEIVKIDKPTHEAYASLPAEGWFERKDGQLIHKDDAIPAFRLFRSEYSYTKI